MIVKALCGASLLLAPASVAPAVPLLDQAIPKVVCPVYENNVLLGWSMGSAVRIGRHFLLSVKHVTSVGNCTINGKPIKVNYEGHPQDFSELTTQDEGATLRMDCGGFVKGRTYLAIGHARGRDELTTIELEGTGIKQDGYSVLIGIETVIPGQSGGAVIDADTHAVVGMVNAYNMEDGTSYSIALKDTSLCRGSAA